MRKLTFTGSTAVGKQLAQAAAPQLERVSMELGGHAPFIVFDDADPAHAARGVALADVALADGSAWDAIGKAYKRLELGDSEYLPAFFEAASGGGAFPR